MTGGPGRDTFLWMPGDLGTDVITDFSLRHDRLAFGPGFLAEGDLAEVLRVEAAGRKGAVLHAETTEAGWQVLAYFRSVTAACLEARIADATIFDTRFDDPVFLAKAPFAESCWDGLA